MDAAKVIDELTYRSYRANRLMDPTIQPERWAKAYPNVAKLEQRFQAEEVAFELSLPAAGGDAIPF